MNRIAGWLMVQLWPLINLGLNPSFITSLDDLEQVTFLNFGFLICVMGLFVPK